MEVFLVCGEMTALWYGVFLSMNLVSIHISCISYLLHLLFILYLLHCLLSVFQMTSLNIAIRPILDSVLCTFLVVVEVFVNEILMNCVIYKINLFILKQFWTYRKVVSIVWVIPLSLSLRLIWVLHFPNPNWIIETEKLAPIQFPDILTITRPSVNLASFLWLSFLRFRNSARIPHCVCWLSHLLRFSLKRYPPLSLCFMNQTFRKSSEQLFCRIFLIWGLLKVCLYIAVNGFLVIYTPEVY